MPGPDLSAPAIADLIVDERVTIAAGVPTIWMGVLPELKGRDTSSLRAIPCGGSAVPKALSEAYREQLGLPILQAWGMTETSPVASVGRIKSTLVTDVRGRDGRAAHARSARSRSASSCRVVEPGTIEPLPWDGEATRRAAGAGPVDRAHVLQRRAVGASRSPTTAGCAPATWPRSTRDGYIRLVDRTKDLIKSGGEWISSVELENELMAHPKVAEAAVIGVPHPKWAERPLACVVVKPGEELTKDEVLDFLAPKVAKWGCPTTWCSSTRCRRPRVGKFSKKDLRDRFADYAPAALIATAG